MSYITIDNLNTINVELTNYCNAACPMCARIKWDGELYKEKVNSVHTSLSLIKNKIPIKVIKQLKKFYSVGTYGDPLMNPECFQIYEWIKMHNENCKLEMHSNGGGRSTDFWSALGSLGVGVMFGIDGLADTNHLYRRNVQWDTLIKNVKAFIKAGGIARWKYIVFKHNEHQIDEARTLSKELGFKNFSYVFSDRWKESNWVTGELREMNKIKVDDYYIEKPTSQKDKYYMSTTVKVYDDEQFNTQKKIVCQVFSNGVHEIYIRANGYVQPCCMLGDLDVHESKNLIKDFDSVNLNKTSLENILNGEYFKSLDKGIAGGPERLHNCFYTCGVK